MMADEPEHDQTPTDPDRWYSDAALAKQAEARNQPADAPPLLSLLVGILEPRIQPTDAEKCDRHGLDTRDQAGGEELNGQRYCSLCLMRGYNEDDD